MEMIRRQLTTGSNYVDFMPQMGQATGYFQSMHATA
jgi:hypothetical protein